ncbi:MAG: ribonuclease Z [Bacteroidetes bacterium]|nr:MAG: ribonuclease Z [Bacteroidota bacterium]
MGIFSFQARPYCIFYDFYGFCHQWNGEWIRQYYKMREFSVTILGSSAALPYKNRNLTAQLVNHAGRSFLIDCGEGTQMQLTRLKLKGMRIGHIFISHLHGDHFYGLIGLISTFHLLGRKDDLHIYGPPDLEIILKMQLEASMTTLVYRMFFHPTQSDFPEVIYEDDGLTITTLPMVHRVPTTGFLFAEKQYPRHINMEAAEILNVPYTSFSDLKLGLDYTASDGAIIHNSDLTIEPGKPRSYACCSDTLFHEPLADIISGCNLMYHEATFMNAMAEVAVAKMHSTAADAARVAEKAGAGKLIIGHFSARYENLLPLLEEARAVFQESYLAEEGNVFQV